MRYTIILAAALAVMAGCGKETKREKAPVRVKTEVAGEAAAQAGRSYVGIVEEREATAVSFTTMGVVRRVYVSEGEPVRRGQLLAEIDATTPSIGMEAAQVTTEQARDMVKQTEAAYAQAKDAYDRMKLLHDNGSLPEIKWIEMQTNLKQAETALNTARSGVVSAQTTEKLARKSLSDTRIYAPVSGVIGKKGIAAGETALPSQAAVNILDISTVKIKVSVPETELNRISSTTRAAVNVEAVGRKYLGERIEKGVQADALTHTYDVYVYVANPDQKLLPGMVADVSLDISEVSAELSAGGRILLPVGSVQKRADGSLFVWTVDKDKRAHRTNVTLGATVGNRVMILSGLQGRERVVTEGYSKLSEGSKVAY